MRIPLGIVSSLLLASLSAIAQQYTIQTVAGGAPPPSNSSAINTPLGGLGAVASDPLGNIYFIADGCVFEDLNGTLMRIAGNSHTGFSGDGGAATSAQLNNPGGIAIDNASNLYIADSGNNRIRKVTLANGMIATLAGTGTASYTGDTGAAANATVNNPQGLAVDSTGNLYIADSGNNVIRKISGGIITTVAGTGIAGAVGDGQLATSAQLNTPMGVAVDVAFDIYIADANNHRIREVRMSPVQGQNGIMFTIAGLGSPGFAGDNGLATNALFNFPTGVAIDTTGNIYVNDFNNKRVRRFMLNGVITTVAGGGTAPVSSPAGIAVDPNNNLYISDSTANQLFKYSTTGGFTVIAGNGSRYFPGDGGPATSAQLVQPQGLAVAGTNVYIADRGAGRIRQFSPGGNISSPTGATGVGPAGVAVDLLGNIYFADAVQNQVLKVSSSGTVTLIAGTGIPGFIDNVTATVSELNQPNGVAVDASGNVYIADTGNNRVRKVTFATGIITTIAGNGTPSYGGDNLASTNGLVNQPADVALDNAANLYIADTVNNRIRKITAATGIITTVAGNGNSAYSGDGGAATSAGIQSPHGVAADSLGNLYITDYSARVRKVSTSGIITTIAGTGTPGYSGDSGSALSAQLNMPWGIAVDGANNVYVSDIGNQAVRELTPVAASPLSVTSPMTLPTGTVGVPYAQTLLASGGTPPYTWFIIVGTLPSGLTLSSNGSLSGTPTNNGSFLLTFQVTDSGSLTAQATIAIIIAPAGQVGLNITSPPTLIAGAVGVSYSQPLTAASGNPPYTWTLVSGALPTGLTLFPSGFISGTPTSPGASSFTLRVNDTLGAVATQTFSLTVISPGTLTQTGAMAHIAVGGTWTTRVYLTNISSAAVAVNLLFYGDNTNPPGYAQAGVPLTIPFTVTQQGSAQQFTANSFNGVLNPNTAIIIDSGTQIANTVTGWISVLSSGAANALAGYAIFQTSEPNGTASDGTASLQTQFDAKMYMPFDNTGGFVTGVAVDNVSPNSATITAIVLDTNGNQLGSYAIQLPGNGHTSFLFPSQFAVTTNQQGLVQFINSSGGAIAGVGLRASTITGAFTSVPVIFP